MNTYLFAGYVVVWTVLFLYLLFLNKRQRQIGEDLKSLSDAIRRRNK
ncbi:MAG: CcmD family protein [Acidobacteria bacterium]|nr:CcmD family protein [Acidobacteriota bacterium]